MRTNLSTPLKLFCCYAHQDEELRDELNVHLTVLGRQNLISTWYDRVITAGTVWEHEIDEHIETADIILLLISASFLTSDYCYGIEMQRALQRHESGNASVIPIVLRPVDWTDAPFSRLQVLPTGGKPVTTWLDRESAFVDIVKNIRRSVEEHSISSLQVLPKPVTSWSNREIVYEDIATNIRRIAQEYSRRTVEFSVQQGDVKTFNSDVIALKYAQNFYGTDKKIALQLIRELKIPEEDLLLAKGQAQLIDTRGLLNKKYVLFVGVPPIDEFDYPQIRQFAADVLRILAIQAPQIEHLVMTIHGIGYGLDEVEAIQSQIAGYMDALREGKFSQHLASITIIDINEARVQRLCKAADEKLTRTNFAEPAGKSGQFRFIIESSGRLPINAAKYDVTGTVEYAKKHAFIAMPFAGDMEDVFHFGIQEPVRSMGLVCERIDETAFTGDILDRVKKKIETASVVIADLTGANPNVYLEVGYAWGKGKPTLLLVKRGQELRFDVQGQRCLKYSSIMNLNEALKRELKSLQEDKII